MVALNDQKGPNTHIHNVVSTQQVGAVTASQLYENVTTNLSNIKAYQALRSQEQQQGQAY
jgi:hypothetical protein